MVCEVLGSDSVSNLGEDHPLSLTLQSSPLRILQWPSSEKTDWVGGVLTMALDDQRAFNNVVVVFGLIPLRYSRKRKRRKKMFRYFRYPTKQQGIIWLRRRQKERPSEIAKDLKVSRPFVTMAQKTAEERILKLLQHAASVNRVKIEHLSTRYGIAKGYCHAYDTDTYIFYSPKIGLQTWYEHKRVCSACEMENQCLRTLRTLAEEWEIPLPDDKPPTELGVYLVDIIERRLKWNQK